MGADDAAGLVEGADPSAVDAVLASSRSLAAIATGSPGPAAGPTTTAQVRALMALAVRGPVRMADLAAALEVLPSTAGRLCDRLARKGLIRRQRAPGNRRVVLVSVTAAGREAAGQVTMRRRVLIAEILARLPPDMQLTVAEAFLMFARAAGELPESPPGFPGHRDPGGYSTSGTGEHAAADGCVRRSTGRVNGYGKQGEGTRH
jgi:DNA-binding MarR family transcriptional regulator